MAISRREFMTLSTQGLALSTLLSSTALGSFSETLSSLFTGTIPICQHMTNAFTTQLSVLTEGKMPYAYRVLDSQGRDIPLTIWDHGIRKYNNTGIDKLFVDNLIPEMTYRLRVIDKDRGTVLDERTFKSLPLATKKSLRFALVSCMDDNFFYQRKNMWNRLFAHKPELIFITGDSVYADIQSDGSADSLWRRYCETRSLLHHFRQPQLIPTLATWDDHDYGVNNGNKNYHLKEFVRKTFDLFWGNKEVSGLRRGHGVSSVLTGFGQRFFLMDDRYFRDEPGLSKGLHWGSDQQDLFFARLSENDKPTWILNGSQFFANYYRQESLLKDYSANFKDILKKLARASAPVVFGSGDVHFSEILEIEPEILGYKTYEITSSSIHSAAIPLGQILQNHRRVEYSWHHNYVIIDSTVTEKGLETKSESFGRFGRRLFSHQGFISRNESSRLQTTDS